jgi:tetratricopeptide (TPR) repeat protein
VLILICALAMAAASGAFGEEMRQLLRAAWQDLNAFLETNEKQLDRVWRAIGALGTILSASWAIYKSWYYAEHNLPTRLAQFLVRNEQRLENARKALLEVIEGPGPRKPFKAPICFVAPMNVALRQLRFGKTVGASSELTAAIDQLQKQISAWEGHRSHLQSQLAAAHLLKGAILAADAGMIRDNRSRADDLIAHDHFDAALQLNDLDAQALTYRGLQSMRLDQVSNAFADFDAAERLFGDEKSKPHVRALYYRAQICAERKPPSLGLANRLMNRASAHMPKEMLDTLEAAEMFEFQGKVREALKFYPAAINSYLAAETTYRKLSASGALGLIRVTVSLSRVRALQDQAVAAADGDQVPQVLA